MEFRIADTFTASLDRLTADEQRAAKTTAFDLQMNPANPGIQMHRIDHSKDRNFWSARINRDLRLVVHRTDASLMLCYANHHDAAFQWVERRFIERHPRTGAAQIVELRETVREIEIPQYVLAEEPAASTSKPRLFDHVTDDALLGYGVPEEWLADARAATEDTLFALADHLFAKAPCSFLRSCLAACVRNDSVITPDLHRVACEGDLHLASPERVADAVVGAREAHRAVAVDLADDDPVRGRTLRSRGERLLQHPLLLLREVPPGVRRHEHRVVKDLHEAVVTDELDGLARQVAADVVLEVEQAHLAVHEHPPEQARGRWTGFTLRGWRHRRRLLEGRRMRGVPSDLRARCRSVTSCAPRRGDASELSRTAYRPRPPGVRAAPRWASGDSTVARADVASTSGPAHRSTTFSTRRTSCCSRSSGGCGTSSVSATSANCCSSVATR